MRRFSRFGSLAALAALCIGTLQTWAGAVSPVAVPQASPTTVIRGLYGPSFGQVTFSQAGSYDPDPAHSIVSYEWDFLGDGTWDTVLTDPLATPVYRYMDTGLFNATLRVTDDQGLTGTSSVPITVVREPEFAPVCDAGGPYSFSDGQSLTLSATAMDANPGDVLTATWDINHDGVYGDATGLSPTVPFATLYPLAQAAPGHSFSILLRVTDQTGRSSVASASVSYVVPTPAALWGGMSLLAGLALARRRW